MLVPPVAAQASHISKLFYNSCFFALAHLDCDMPEMLQFGPEVCCTYLKENGFGFSSRFSKGVDNSLKMKRSLVLLASSLLLLAACGSSTSPSPTSSVTHKPTPIVTPTHIARLIIGAPIQDFVTILGAPAKVAPPNPNKVYYFQPNPADGNQYHYQVIVGKGKDGQEHITEFFFQLWNGEQNQIDCNRFKADHASPAGTTPDGEIFTSPDLNGIFPAGDFVDTNLKPVTPGTFEVISFLAKSGPTHVLGCHILIGEQTMGG